LTHPALDSAVLPSRGVVLAVGCVLVAVVVVVVWVRRGSPAWRRALTTTLADARLGLLPRSTWPGAVLLSAVTVAGHVAMFVVAARVAGLSAPAVQLAPLMVLALVVMGLPVNIGGWGPREGFLAVAFGVAGLGAAQGVTASVVYGVLTLVSSLPGAVVLFLRRDRFYGSRIARYSPKHSTRPARRSFPLLGDARDGRPITPDSV
jgi:glycosyltransferase 2 family protein